MDPATLRERIPALQETVYLNTGASGPAPRPVVDAATAAVSHQEFTAPGAEGMYPAAFSVFSDTRSALGTYLNTPSDRIALTQSTADSIGRLAAAVDWNPGDVVVRTATEHPAGVLPWERLERQYDVDVRVVETTNGHVDRDQYLDAVKDARLVCLSSICWLTGARRDVATLTSIAHDAGARVLVDAVQSIGQQPIDLQTWDVDALAASGHKWLLGEWGAGLLYVDDEFVQELHPAQVGYRGVTDPKSPGYQFRPDARRFEQGTTAIGPYAALQEAISINQDLGWATITDRIERLTDRLKDGLGRDRLVSPLDYESGLVSFRVDDPEATVDRLADNGIRIRAVPRSNTVRASVHVFNTAEDIDQLLAAL